MFVAGTSQCLGWDETWGDESLCRMPLEDLPKNITDPGFKPRLYQPTSDVPDFCTKALVRVLAGMGHDAASCT